METISNSIQVSKPTRRLPGFITDRVFIALVLALSVLTILDQSQAYQSLRFTLQSMMGIAPFFILAIAFAGYAKASGFDAHIAMDDFRILSGKHHDRLHTGAMDYEYRRRQEHFCASAGIYCRHTCLYERLRRHSTDIGPYGNGNDPGGGNGIYYFRRRLLDPGGPRRVCFGEKIHICVVYSLWSDRINAGGIPFSN